MVGIDFVVCKTKWKSKEITFNYQLFILLVLNKNRKNDK
ncbi:hypothetical protein IGI50_003158 [Enterococcus sp. DIV0170]